MRSRFDEQLTLLHKEMIEMGALCEEAITLVTDALSGNTPQAIGKVATITGSINQMERDIESRCLKLLLQQQPVAKDLRVISAALKMITDMERIGDKAEDIEEIIPYLDGKIIDEKIHIKEMAEATIKMVTESVNAYVKQDIEMAQSVIAYDDIVDRYFDKIKSELIELITQNQGKEYGGYALDLLMISKYFERIGDHATNIAQWVIFSVTGVHKEEPS